VRELSRAKNGEPATIANNVLMKTAERYAEQSLAWVRLYADIPRHLIKNLVAKSAACSFLPDTAPLLEKEGCLRSATGALNLADPFFLHRSRPRSAFPADDSPMNIREIAPGYRSK
jgi:hypothetical protein